MKSKILLFIYALTISTLYAQNSVTEILEESYPSIYKKINAAKENPTQQQLLLEAFMLKARKENNWKQIVQGYKNYLHHSPREQMVVYGDSMVLAALESNDSKLIASAYLTKGLTYYWRKQYVKALDNYVLSNEYLQKNDSVDPYLKHKLSYNMGLIKYYLEQYDEALTALKSCLDYFKVHNNAAYLVTLHLTGQTYRGLGNYKMSSQINSQGLEKGKEVGNQSFEVYFKESEAINQYYYQNYQSAIDTLEKVIPEIKNLGDFANVTLGNYYIGKSYWDLNKQETAIPYLKLVDQSITDNEYIKNEILDTYTMLENYYKSIGDSTTYHQYQGKHLQMTNTLMDRHKSLFPKINTEYDQANIIKEQERRENKEKLSKQSELSNWLLWILILGGLVVLTAVLWYYRSWKEKNLKKQFDNLYPYTPSNADVSSTSDLSEQDNSETYLDEGDVSTIEINEDNISKPEISVQKVNQILEQLETFENEKKYLDKSMSLAFLASSFDTNTPYISYVINQKKGKKFLEYINDLRVEYLIEYAKKHKSHNGPTLLDLANIGGFTNLRNLREAFRSKIGITASEFLRGLANAPTDKE